MNKIKDKVPYPSDWKVKKLGELGSFLKGKGISKSETKESGLPCIRYGEIYTRHHNYIKEFYSFIDEETAKNSTRIRKGDILFAGSGETMEEIGKSVAFLHEEQAYAGGDIIILRTKDVDTQYLAFALNEGRLAKERAKLGQGHSVVHIYPKELKELIIHLPSNIEQQKIASILSTWDKAIELKEKLIEQKKVQKKGLMQKLLTGEVRLPGFAGRWQQVRLGKFTKLQGGYAFKSTEFVQQGIPIIRISNIDPEITDTNQDFVYYDEIGISDSFKVNFGDILIAMSGATTGKVGLYKKREIAYLNQRVGKFVILDKSKLDYSFLYHLIMSSMFKLQLKEELATGAQPNISSKQIENFKFNIPSLDEQKKISRTLNQIDRSIILQEKEIALLKHQKQGLMQQLLTGKIRVKV